MFLGPHTPEALHFSVPGSPLRSQFDLLYVIVFLRRPKLWQKLVIRYVGGRLRCDTDLTAVEIILDRVSIAHVVFFVVRVIVNLSEQAVSAHGSVVVHLRGAVPRVRQFLGVDAAAAHKRQPSTGVNKQQYEKVTQRGEHSRSTTASHEMTEGLD